MLASKADSDSDSSLIPIQILPMKAFADSNFRIMLNVLPLSLKHSQKIQAIQQGLPRGVSYIGKPGKGFPR